MAFDRAEIREVAPGAPPTDSGAGAPQTRLLQRFTALLGLFDRTIREAIDHRILRVAAEVAFFGLLALPSMLLVIAGAAGYLGALFGSDAQRTFQQNLISWLSKVLSPETMSSFVGPAVDHLFKRGRAGVLSIGVIVALWSISRMVSILIEATNIAYNLKDHRAAWRRRLLAIGISVSGVLVLVVAIPLTVAGPGLGDAIAHGAHLPTSVGRVWRILYWPGAVAGGVAMLATFYRVAPDRRAPWRWGVPGALLAAITWVGSAFGLRVYVRAALSEAAVGPLAAPLILMLWLYLSAVAVLLGAVLNAVIERSRVASIARLEA